MSTGHTRILTESDIGALSQTPSCPVFLLKMPVTHQLRLTRTAEIMFFGKTVTSRRHAIPGTTCGVLNPAVVATAWLEVLQGLSRWTLFVASVPAVGKGQAALENPRGISSPG